MRRRSSVPYSDQQTNMTTNGFTPESDKMIHVSVNMQTYLGLFINVYLNLVYF